MWSTYRREFTIDELLIGDLVDLGVEHGQDLFGAHRVDDKLKGGDLVQVHGVVRRVQVRGQDWRFKEAVDVQGQVL